MQVRPCRIRFNLKVQINVQKMQFGIFPVIAFGAEWTMLYPYSYTDFFLSSTTLITTELISTSTIQLLPLPCTNVPTRSLTEMVIKYVLTFSFLNNFSGAPQLIGIATHNFSKSCSSVCQPPVLLCPFDIVVKGGSPCQPFSSTLLPPL